MNKKAKTAVRSSLFALSVALTPVIVGTLALGQSGCLFSSPGPSAVSLGQKYQSGDPNFDEFFSALYDMQIDLAKAPDAEKQIRETLAKKVKLEEGGSASLLSKKISKRLEELAGAGTGVKLELKGLEEGEDPSADMGVKGKPLEGDDKDMVDGVTDAARDAVKLYVKMRKAKKQLEGFTAKMLALEPTMDTAFRLGGPKKKAEVRKNLEDAKKLIPLMDARAEEVGEAAKTLAKKLAEAATTDDKIAAPAPPPEPAAEPEAENPEKAGEKGDKKKKGEKKEKKGEKPAAEKPAGEKPAGEKPAGEKPAGEKPAQDFEP